MRVQRGNSHLAHLRSNYQPRMLDLARDVMQLLCTSSLHGRNHPAGNYSLLPDPNTRAGSHDVTRALKKKQTSQSEGFSTRAHVLCPSVTCAVHSANRTHCAGRVEFHTRVHVENPSVPNSLPSLAFVRPRDQLHLPRAFPDRASPSQPCTRGSRPLHSTDHPYAAV